MTGAERPGLFRRMWVRFGGTLKRSVLGKSMDRFGGSDAYWERVIAAQLGWPQQKPPGPDPEHFPGSEPAYEPLHG